MPTFTLNNRIFSIGLCALLAACGGGGGDDPPDIAPAHNQSAAGIWVGTMAINGGAARTAIAAIADDGRFAAVAGRSSPSVPDGRVMTGTGVVAVSTLTATGAAYSAAAFANGAFGVTINVNGTVAERATISATTTGGGETGQLALTFDPTYDRTPSFAVLNGVYSSSASTTPVGVMTIANGVLTYNSNSCVGNGAISIINPAKNLYSWTLTVSSLAGLVCGNPGVFTGLAFLGDTNGGTNNVLFMFASRDNTGTTTGMSFIGTR